jgi:hypothetical protein
MIECYKETHACSIKYGFPVKEEIKDARVANI